MTLCPVCRFSYEPAATGGACPRCALTGALAAATGPVPTDDFEFIAELGRGAMGMVSLVRQRSLDRLVALKVIAVGGRPAEWLEARLLREARAAAQLSHPHIVTIHEVGHGPAGAFLAMEYCEGGDLRAQLRQNPLPSRAAAALVEKLADAIAHAHAAGVLHRDLKPSNILLTAAGEPKVSDFGLTATAHSDGASEFTQPGEVAGSPSYLAPETLLPGTPPAPTVDVYGLGGVLYEGVTGRPPFTGESPASVLVQIAQSEPAAPRTLTPGLPRDLETIILKCLEKNPSARYATAIALRDDLRRFLEGRPIAARPVSPAGRAWRWARRSPALAASLAVAGLLLVALAGLSTAAAVRSDREQRRTAAALARTAQAEAAAREQARTALVAQARATRFTARTGQRLEALKALREAAAIRPGIDARNEAIAALTLPDWDEPRDPLKVWSDPGLSTVTPLPGFAGFIHETAQGVFSRRTFPANAVQWTWPGRDSPSAGTTIVSPDGRWLAVRLQNDEVHVLDAATGRPLFQLAGRPFAFKPSRIWGYGTDMAFSPDGALFAATRPEGGVTFHRLPDGALAHAWTTREWIVSLAFSNNGRWLAAGGARERHDNLLALIDTATGRELAREKLPTRATFVAWSADDRWLALGTSPVQVRASADLSLRNVVPEKAALHARFLADNRSLLLSEQVSHTTLWDIDSGRRLLDKADSGRPGVWFDGQPLRQWRYFGAGGVVLAEFHPSPVLSSIRPVNTGYTVPAVADPLDLSPDGRWLLLGGWRGPALVDLAAPRVVRQLALGPLNSGSVARFDATGEALWVGQTAGPLQRLPFTIGADGLPVTGPGEPIAGLDGFLPTALHRGTGVLALTDFRGGEVRLYDTRARRVLSSWPLARATHVAFSPDGRQVLSNGDPFGGARAEIRDVATGSLVRTLGEGTGRQALWSDDGRLVLIGTGDRALGLWHADTWTPAAALPAELQSHNHTAAFSSDRRLLAMRFDRTLVLLRPDSLEILARLEMPGSVSQTAGLRFTADGRRLIAARLDGQVDLWEIATLRTELAKLGLDWPD
ncbi:MAG: WD40 repeat domain-containing serine/threonine-protein kinase [Verrucomicrobia bacterium]|nr:WD40 repeat domain-containing serine/threonine-protein kinase [Verrucomicrobiota bacterium]